MAQVLGFHRMKASPGNDPSATARYRTVWVIYMLERQICFHVGNSPVSAALVYPLAKLYLILSKILADYDIGCLIPPSVESIVEGFDFFVAILRLSRLCSKAYQSLFAVNATVNKPQQYRISIDSIRGSLHSWLESIPVKFRPNMPFCSADTCTTFMLLRIHYLYHALVMSICRLELHLEAKAEADRKRLEDAKKELVGAARTVIQLTTYLDIRPYMPNW